MYRVALIYMYLKSLLKKSRSWNVSDKFPMVGKDSASHNSPTSRYFQ